MIGLPVCMEARATARWTFSTLGVTPGASAAHLMNAGLMGVPWMPFSSSWTKIAAIPSSSRLSQDLRQVVVGVDAGGEDRRCRPLSSATRLLNAASRVRNMALGSTTVFTPWPSTAFASAIAASHSACSS